MSIESISFRANWNPANSHLKDPIPTTFQKVARLAWNIFSIALPIIGLARLLGYAIGSLANRITLPAAHSLTPERLAEATKNFNDFWLEPITPASEAIRKIFTATEHTIITPDHAALKAKLVRHKDSGEDTPTVIYFNGNFQLAMEDPDPWLLEESIKRNVPCNFVFFDYRGVGHSTGKFKAAKDLIVDGSSIAQWVQNSLQTKPDQIHFYGFSLGGAIAALTQSLDPKTFSGAHLNERSFASSEAMLKSMFGNGCFGKLMNWTFQQQGYSANAAAGFRKLQGRKLVVYHVRDQIIPYQASLQRYVQHNNSLQLEPKPGIARMFLGKPTTYRELSSENPHCAPLQWFEGATNEIADFLLGPASADLKEVI